MKLKLIALSREKAYYEIDSQKINNYNTTLIHLKVINNMICK